MRDERTPLVARLGKALLRLAAIGYLLALLVVTVAFRYIGERWWPITVGLYLPRWGFGLPLPVLTALLLIFGPRRLLVTQGLAVILLLFPLMGMHLSWAASPTPGAFHLKVVSYNVDSGHEGPDAVVAQLRAANADLVLVQELRGRLRDALNAGLPGYHVHTDGQFWTGSRFPIEQVFTGEKVINDDIARSSRFIRYQIATPAGSIYVYNVHPISPRDAFDDLRGRGIRHELASGRLFGGFGAERVNSSAKLRLQQVQAVAEDASRSPYPVLIAGDTNLPTLSWGFARWLGRFKDGFAEVGAGFGYTFPSLKHPWMRIDRVLASPPFRFLRFAVATERTSDHLAVSAELELPEK